MNLGLIDKATQVQGGAVERRRKATSTSSFGVSKRESHDASPFYSRFSLPVISADHEVGRNPPEALDRIHIGDSRTMPAVEESSVALVVTSPPYFAGKEYEEALGQGHVPGTYIEYLAMLTEVFAECVRKLEPGGRIAVNVANLGRKPYRSLAADVISILQDELGMLLRGEIVWIKGRGASGSCAWGSWQSPANPVLRDLSERIVIASKGRFDRALNRRERALKRLPSEASIFKDDFMEATTDVWDIPAASATRVNHPAPFPVELPQRLIELYTYRDDVVLDPFMGSGTTAVAAIRSERHFVGYDMDASYVELALTRVQAERATPAEGQPRAALPARPAPERKGEPAHARAVREGGLAKEIARAVLEDCGFNDIKADVRFHGGVEVGFTATDIAGRPWLFDVSGAFTTTRAGLRRLDTVWKALGKASVLKSFQPDDHRLILLTTELPANNSPGGKALRAAQNDIFHDAIALLSSEGHVRLACYASSSGSVALAEAVLLPAHDETS
jgi:site-specific DNA-methyltransferase (adenine-specific)